MYFSQMHLKCALAKSSLSVVEYLVSGSFNFLLVKATGCKQLFSSNCDSTHLKAEWLVPVYKLNSLSKLKRAKHGLEIKAFFKSSNSASAFLFQTKQPFF